MKQVLKTGLVTLLLTTALVAAQASAAVVLWPVRLAFAPDQRSSELWVENRGQQPVRLQFRLHAWQQRDGADQLTPQDRIALSPPFAEVGPGERQLVRVVRLDAQRPSAETAYRLTVDEIPDPAAPASAGIRFRMRYELPVFVAAAGMIAPDLDYHIAAGRLRIRNRGDGHARLTQLRLRQRDGREEVLVSGLLGYVLAGAELGWPLPTGVSAGAALVVEANGKQVELVDRAR